MTSLEFQNEDQLAEQYHKITAASEPQAEEGETPLNERLLRRLDELNLSKESHDRLRAELSGYGPLDFLLSGQRPTECLVRGPNNIFVEWAGGFTPHPARFISPESYERILNRIFDEAGVTVHLARPFATGRWHNYRIHVVAPPVSGCFKEVSLRHHPPGGMSLESLGLLDAPGLKILKDSVAAKENILLVGPTGSGKTTVAGALLKLVGPDERVVVIEDCEELPLPNDLSCRLLTRDPEPDLPGVDQCELVRQSLRLRPQRLILGEMRGAEAKDYLMALATGHSGSVSTLHSSCARQALIRLEMLIQLGAPQWSLQAIRHLIRLAVHKIVVLENQGGLRRARSIHQIHALEESGIILGDLWSSQGSVEY